MLKDSGIYASIDSDFRGIMEKYDESILEMVGISPFQVDFRNYMEKLTGRNFSTMADFSADPNANVAQTTITSILQEAPKPLMKLANLNEIYRRTREEKGKAQADNLLRMLIEGGLYANDLHLFTMPYCFNFSAGTLMYQGLPFIPKTPSKPARHADSFLQHASQLVMYASNNQAGAVALTGLFVAYSWYVKRDRLSKKEVLQQLQLFTYTVNQPIRLSMQTPFLNITIFDRNYLSSLYGDFIYPDGTKPDIEHIVELQKWFVEWFINEIETTGIVFTFPVITASLLLDKDTKRPMDEEFVNWLVKANSTLGLVNIYMSPRAGSLSSCCRLANDLEGMGMLGDMNSFGAGGDGIGSVGVCTVNLPQIAQKARRINPDNPVPVFFSLLDDHVRSAQDVVLLRRSLVEENIRKGLLPLYSHGFINLENQYCTVGFVGMYEAGHFLGMTQSDLFGDYMKFAGAVLDHINRLNRAREEATDVPFNTEQVPAEGMAVSLAKRDRALGYQSEFPIYSNQWIPLTSGADFLSRIAFAGELDGAVSGGAILHITVDGKISSEVQRRLLYWAAEQGVVYFAFNYVLSSCQGCGTVTQGDISVCPRCGATRIETYTRVVGFVTPVSNWQKERRDEFHRRERYNIDARHKELCDKAFAPSEMKVG